MLKFLLRELCGYTEFNFSLSAAQDGEPGWKKIENLPTFSSLDARYSKNPQTFSMDSFPGKINLI